MDEPCQLYFPDFPITCVDLEDFRDFGVGNVTLEKRLHQIISSGSQKTISKKLLPDYIFYLLPSLKEKSKERVSVPQLYRWEENLWKDSVDFEDPRETAYMLMNILEDEKYDSERTLICFDSYVMYCYETAGDSFDCISHITSFNEVLKIFQKTSGYRCPKEYWRKEGQYITQSGNIVGIFQGGGASVLVQLGS